MITEGFSFTFWARSDCFHGGVFSALAFAIAFPTETSTLGGGATSFSRSIFVSLCPSVLCAAFVLCPATNQHLWSKTPESGGSGLESGAKVPVNFFSAWRVPCRAAALMPAFDFTVVERVWCALYPILVTVSHSAGRLER